MLARVDVRPLISNTAPKCEINVVQSSLLGSILSNLLLVLGMLVPVLCSTPERDSNPPRLSSRRCFFAGGIKFSEQGFKDTAAQLNSSLLVVSVIGSWSASQPLGTLTYRPPAQPSLFRLDTTRRLGSSSRRHMFLKSSPTLD